MARAKMACAKVSLRQSVPAPKCLAPSRPRQVGRAKSAAPNCPRPHYAMSMEEIGDTEKFYITTCHPNNFNSSIYTYKPTLKINIKFYSTSIS
ncbi:hypothetical protein Zmor_023596 [Zophobas morio]|uniref:Uncharacterized protein n=1 Tax=Zophobas morio TaxID=2755281 RepID=A0AA38M7A1_9CUCU|nr:hypothetical protein Zmor_023596 [Zophobas morio]